MANKALIRGAALTGKKFLDVGGAVAAGAAATSAYVPDDRVAENKAIQNRVNSYMGKMKTDMDFTSFSPSETKTMRNFLLSQRTKYTDAAKKAAEFDDTTDPNYMLYIQKEHLHENLKKLLLYMDFTMPMVTIEATPGMTHPSKYKTAVI